MAYERRFGGVVELKQETHNSNKKSGNIRRSPKQKIKRSVVIQQVVSRYFRISKISQIHGDKFIFHFS